MAINKSVFKYDLSLNGWSLISNNNNIEQQNIMHLETIVVVKTNEEYIVWQEMIKRSVDLNASATQKLAEFLLLNKKKIPRSWNPYNIIFPGTIWQSKTGELFCPYLKWYNGWRLSFYWFLYDFHHNDRFVRFIQ